MGSNLNFVHYMYTCLFYQKFVCFQVLYIFNFDVNDTKYMLMLFNVSLMYPHRLVTSRLKTKFYPAGKTPLSGITELFRPGLSKTLVLVYGCYYGRRII